MKKLVTEIDVINLIRSGSRVLIVEDGYIFTPLALDKIKEKKITVVNKSKTKNSNIIRIAIGSDHTGYTVKLLLIEYLQAKNYVVEDVGTFSEESCDYPDFAIAVAKKVLLENVNFGILIDATGIPSAITANKFPGIRATTCYDEFSVKSAREHNNANILVLGAKTLNEEKIKLLVDIWLTTEFAGERHQKRIDKIIELEKKILK
ncbi:MAG: ribose 5-phosphate isomerase B [Ignavibacteriales bacterium]|nr:ribose 5-phosphate isomerase B [Ignavibacteriales bacterium]